MSGQGRGGRKDKRKIIEISPKKGVTEKTQKTRRTSTGKLKMASDSTGKNEGNPGEPAQQSLQSEPVDSTALDLSSIAGLNPEKGVESVDNTAWLQALNAVSDKIMSGMNKRFDEQDTRIETRMTSNAQSIATTMATIQSDIAAKFTNYDIAQKQQVTRADNMDRSMSTLQTQMTTHTSTVSSLSSEFQTMQKAIQADLTLLRAQVDKGTPPRQGAWSAPRTMSSAPSEFELSLQIAGIPEEPEENLLDKVCSQVFSLMGLYYNSDHIVECNRVGRERTPPEEGSDVKVRPRPIYVKFYLALTKDKVMRQRFRLRKKGIWVNDSYPINIERARQRLRPIVQKANRMLEYDGRIELKDDKVVLDGTPIGVDELHKIPDNIHPRDICTERRGGVTFFFRQDSPLSNHHSCLINVAGKTFNCVEQGYYYQKAVTCNDDAARDRLMKTRSAGVQKGIGDSIKSNEAWESSKVEVMRNICKLKFVQNLDLKQFLMATETTLLAEDNPNDSFWAINLSRNSPRAKNVQNFKRNELGQILMQIRTDFE